MTYGITGNTQKEGLWTPAGHLVQWLQARGIAYCLAPDVAQGLAERLLLAPEAAHAHTSDDLAAGCDLLLSFGGDGTFLRSAHAVGTRQTPILGVNIGRLGFLADIEVGQLLAAIERLEAGDYRLEDRMVLEARAAAGIELPVQWALNEFVIERSGSAKLLAIDVSVGGVPLNRYWADGLIVATPTGSTAYSLSAGGPIMMPGCGAMILTPIAPHTLTVRPLVLPETALVEARVLAPDAGFHVTVDGFSAPCLGEGVALTLGRAAHCVRLVKLPEQHYFETLRSKLMWGARAAK